MLFLYFLVKDPCASGVCSWVLGCSRDDIKVSLFLSWEIVFLMIEGRALMSVGSVLVFVVLNLK